MKTMFTRTLLAALIVAGSAVAYGQTAPQERLYAAIDYMHIPENKSADDYVALEKLWQRLHQKAVDAGICRAWYLERVENGGRGDYVTVRVYDSLEKLTNPWPDSLRKNLYNSAETEKMQKTEEHRELIHSELWQVDAMAGKSGNAGPAKLLVQFMKPKPGKQEDAFNLETKTWNKIQQARIDAGELNTWYVLSRMYPSGTDSDYDYVTMDGVDEKGQVWNEKTVEKALGKDEFAKLPDAGAIRTMVRRETWYPVLRTTPKK